MNGSGNNIDRIRFGIHNAGIWKRWVGRPTGVIDLLLKGLLLAVMLLAVPGLSGVAVCKGLGIRRTATGCYLSGSFAEWAAIQILAVPMVIFRCSFTAVVIVVSAVLGVLSLCGLYGLITEKPKIRLWEEKPSFSGWFALVLMIAVYVYTAVSFYMLQHVDHDDARFVVTAVDMVRTDRMFLTNPSTGAALEGFWADMHRDAVSPWAVYIAYVSRLSGVQATSVAHVVLPQTLLFCAGCAYWMLADTFFHGDLFAVCGTVFLGLLVNLFGVRSVYSAEAFTMLRIWQGKATLAAAGIPTLFLSGVWIFRESDGWKKYVFLYIVSFAVCLMTGMGIILSGVFIGVTGAVYGILKKKITVTLKIWIGLLIPLAYYGVSLLNY